jgi:hypothetical protein
MRLASRFALFLIFGATLAGAQIPTTISGTCSIALPASFGLPAGLTFDGTTLTVPKLSTALLTLTGGIAYPDGQYLASLKSGVLTYVPYVAPAAGSGSTSPAGKTYTVAIPQQSGWSLNWYPVPGAVVAAGQTYSVSPAFAGAPPTTFNYFDETLFVNSAGAVYIRVANGTGNVFAASSALVTIR